MKKLGLLLVVVLILIGCRPNEVEMPIGTEIADLILKENRTTQEEQAIRDWFSKAESSLKNFGAGNKLTIDDIEAVTGNFVQSSPLQASQLTIAQQSIPNNTPTTVTFNAVSLNHNGLIAWDSTAPTKVQLLGAQQGKAVQMSFYSVWALSSAGDRSITVFAYDKDDAQLSARTISYLDAYVTSATAPSTIYIFPATTDYVLIKVLQSSGSALNLDRFDFSMIVIK